MTVGSSLVNFTPRIEKKTSQTLKIEKDANKSFPQNAAKKGSKQQHWSWHLYLWPCYQISFFANLKFFRIGLL
jgi:hypothetical protein